MTPAIVARADAKAAGQKRFFTGRPCGRGHVAERLTSSGSCVACHAATHGAWRKRNDDKVAAMRASYRETNRDRLIDVQADWYRRNKERAAKTDREWRKANPGRARARVAKYGARKLHATPQWLTPEHHREIAAVYVEAARLQNETGEPYHVDHIVPLQGRTVCGLHVPWNLRAIPANDNRRKSNKWAVA